MRSKTVILPGERQEDFDALAAGWRAEYGGDGQATESMLQRVILADWFLERMERRYVEAEAELAELKPGERTEEHDKRIELCLRYKTTHERSFFRAFYALRALRKDKLREELDLKRFEERMDKLAKEAFERAASGHEAEMQAKAENGAAEPEQTRGGDGKRGVQATKRESRKPLMAEMWVESGAELFRQKSAMGARARSA